ncbi:MAG TPA: Spy/CpxP family protein refolding chaperone, partial [Halomonas sp.]|nr:Spy/CpxP family protein refolding chaperone [Halomonas sp.]
AIALAAGLSIAASGAVSAQQGNMGPGMMGYGQGGTGPGMMGYGQGGTGPGMMGYGQGGMGPGMMGYGQGGTGPGMMGYGRGGMGPGMMGYGQGGMGPGMMGYGPGGMGPCMMGYGVIQGLDAEQRNQMRELMQQHRPAQFERMGKMMDLRMELMAAMEADAPDAEQIRSLYGQMGELRGEMMAEMARMRASMFDLLTDEQREQLQQGIGFPGSSQ